jgi:hypothetical protein
MRNIKVVVPNPSCALPQGYVMEYHKDQNKKEIVLSGSVTDVSRQCVDLHYGEQVTFAIEGAVPLWAEVRVPNNRGWVVGDRVSICIVSEETNAAREAA